MANRTRRYAFACSRCSRLCAALADDRRVNPSHVASPIGARGSVRARLLVVGLAPGRKGANRTGLVFAGDSSGEVLFRALAEHGFASCTDPYEARLQDARLTNAVKCWPPGNQPAIEERNNCAPYLAQEVDDLWRPGLRRPRVILALGRYAYEALGRLEPLADREGWPAFSHGAGGWLAPSLCLLTAFHPSRQNMNTGRLTQQAFTRVVGMARKILGPADTSG